MENHPNNHFSKTCYFPAGNWSEGLAYATEDIADSVQKRWTVTNWTQDNTSLNYMLNPRVTETKVGDEANVKRTTVSYHLQSGSTTASLYGLVSEVKVYDANQTTVLKRATTNYNLASAYLDRRIIGLPLESEVYDQSDILMSKVTYAYDGSNFAATNLQQSIAPIQHDITNYGASLITGRGNLTSTTWCDAATSSDSTCVGGVSSSVKYNTAGAAVAQTAPGSAINTTRQVIISYADAFNDGINNRDTYAYPTKITDPASNFSEVKYRYDIGANVWAKSPAPHGNSYGKETTRDFDTLGRLSKESIWKHNQQTAYIYAYTRYEYPENGIQSQVYSTVTDTNGNNVADSADEVLAESFTDGAGRVLKSRTPVTFDTNGNTATWTGQVVEYDLLGQVKKQSVPTEVNASWGLAGDDATRGTWLWTHQKYDWKGRVVREIKTDGADSPTLNDSDQLISYEGCGCAGGQVTTIQGELVPVPNLSNSFARRTQKIYQDILGRTYKTVSMNWDGTTPDSTIVTEFNGRDQATSVKQYAGAESPSNPFQETLMTYDGHGRLKTQHRPEQIKPNNTLGYTTYNYNADDSIESVIDARGAKTSYGYNVHGVNSISYSDLNSLGIPLPTAISFDYDALGNRTFMVDGLGRVDYEYNELSQMTAETRDFTDSLVNAPISGDKYKLEYAYDLSGELKSYKDPFGVQINYTHDKIGRLGTVASATTTYASGAEYRAWGALKHLDYGNGTAMNIGGFSNKLQATTFEVKRGSTQLMSKQYEFYSDGMMKKETDSLNAKFDRSYQYDYLARLTETRTGAEARGQTGSLVNIPYRNSYQYDAFGNQTQNAFKHYTGTGVINQTYQNNRITDNGGIGPFYDAEGNLTAGEQSVRGKSWTYDASGKLTQTYLSAGNVDEEFFTYDGNGLLVKHKTSDQDDSNPAVIESEYQLRSSVMKGEVITELDTTGSKRRTFVRANGTVVATHSPTYGNVWMHKDPNLNSLRSTDSSGQVVTHNIYGSDYEPTELDPTGKSVGFSDPYSYGTPYVNTDLLPMFDTYDQMVNGQLTTTTLDGMRVPQDYLEKALHTTFGSTLSAFEHRARMSARPARKIGEWQRTVSYNLTWGMNSEDLTQTWISTTTHTSVFTTSVVYENNSNDWSLSSMLLESSRRPKKLIIDNFFNTVEKQGVIYLTLKDSIAASDLLETVLKTKDCYDAITRLFNELGTKDNPLLTNDVMRLFYDINSQTTGGLRFGKSNIDIDNEYLEATGFPTNVHINRGTSFRSQHSRGFNAYLYVSTNGYTMQSQNFIGPQHKAFDQFVTLIHELAHLAGSKQTYSEAQINAAAKALGVSDIDDYVKQHCVPKSYQ